MSRLLNQTSDNITTKEDEQKLMNQTSDNITTKEDELLFEVMNQTSLIQYNDQRG